MHQIAEMSDCLLEHGPRRSFRLVRFSEHAAFAARHILPVPSSLSYGSWLQCLRPSPLGAVNQDRFTLQVFQNENEYLGTVTVDSVDHALPEVREAITTQIPMAVPISYLFLGGTVNARSKVLFLISMASTEAFLLHHLLLGLFWCGSPRDLVSYCIGSLIHERRRLDR